MEIGSACGYSLLLIGYTIHQRGGTVIGCERTYPNRVELRKLLSLAHSYGLMNLHCLYGSFLNLNPLQLIKNDELKTNSYELVFIDAQKSEYSDYIHYLHNNNLINKKTILIFDDVIKYAEKIAGLIETLEYYGFGFEIQQLDDDDGVMIARGKT